MLHNRTDSIELHTKRFTRPLPFHFVWVNGYFKSVHHCHSRCFRASIFSEPALSFAPPRMLPQPVLRRKTGISATLGRLNDRTQYTALLIGRDSMGKPANQIRPIVSSRDIYAALRSLVAALLPLAYAQNGPPTSPGAARVDRSEYLELVKGRPARSK